MILHELVILDKSSIRESFMFSWTADELKFFVLSSYEMRIGRPFVRGQCQTPPVVPKQMLGYSNSLPQAK